VSPTVQVRCYPPEDAAFHQRVAIHLTIDLPDSYTPEDVVAEMQHRLREAFPLACIRVDPADEPIWHVYRDGPDDVSVPAGLVEA
jgi:hypothetical protein